MFKSSLMNLILLFKFFILIYKLYYNLTESYHVVRAGLQFTILMAQLPECWGYRNAPPYMAQPIILLRTPLKYTFKVTLRRKKFDNKLVILFFIFLLVGGNFVLPNIKN